MLTNKDKLNMAINVSNNLIEIDVSKLRKIKDLSCYKKRISSALKKVFDFFEIEENNIIEKLYIFHENKLKEEETLYAELGYKKDAFTTNYLDNSLEKCVEIYCNLNDHVFHNVSNICQSYLNKKFPLYQLERPFSKIINDFIKEMDLPEQLIYEVHSKLTVAKNDYIAEINTISELIGYSWYQKEKDLESILFNNKLEKQDLNEKIEKIKNGNKKEAKITNKKWEEILKNNEKTEEQKQANKYKNNHMLIIRNLTRYGIYKEDTKEFSFLPFIGFKEMFNEKCDKQNNKYGLNQKGENISSFLTNYEIKEILLLFSEMGLNGRLDEHEPKYRTNKTQQKYIDQNDNITYEKIEFGKPYLTDLSITIPDKVKWDKQYNDKLELLLSHYGLPKENLSYNNNKPVIKL